MTSKTSKAANLFLFANLLCYILSAAACGSCPSFPSPGGRGGRRGSPGGSPQFPPPSGGGGNPGGTTGATCPRDALKLGVCANVLGLVSVVIGSPPTLPCCSLLAGLVDLEAAVCLCTAIRANVLGINLNVPLSLSLLLNVCGRNTPSGFICA